MAPNYEYLPCDSSFIQNSLVLSYFCLVGMITSCRGGKTGTDKLSDLPKVPQQVNFLIFCAAFCKLQITIILDLGEYVSSDGRLMIIVYLSLNFL